jgi:putative ABC transport system substrate-binding protein
MMDRRTFVGTAAGALFVRAHPGGNVTGGTGISSELSAKRLELLNEVVPGLTRVAIMWNPDLRGAVFEYKETASAARALRLQVQAVEVSRAKALGLTIPPSLLRRADEVLQ